MLTGMFLTGMFCFDDLMVSTRKMYHPRLENSSHIHTPPWRHFTWVRANNGFGMTDEITQPDFPITVRIAVISILWPAIVSLISKFQPGCRRLNLSSISQDP